MAEEGEEEEGHDYHRITVGSLSFFSAFAPVRADTSSVVVVPGLNPIALDSSPLPITSY